MRTTNRDTSPATGVPQYLNIDSRRTPRGGSFGTLLIPVGCLGVELSQLCVLGFCVQCSCFPHSREASGGVHPQQALIYCVPSFCALYGEGGREGEKSKWGGMKYV